MLKHIQYFIGYSLLRLNSFPSKSLQYYKLVLFIKSVKNNNDMPNITSVGRLECSLA